MITRIVRMTFKNENTDEFLRIFTTSKQKIREFPGCLYLSLHRDHHDACVYYTVSRWKSQENLDDYRRSDLFTATWTQTKKLFSDKPAAFSLDQLMDLP